MNIEQNMWSYDLPASPDKFDLLHWYHCWYTVNNPWQIENCMYYIHTLKEIDNSGITAYMQKTCDVAEKAILAKKKLRKKCVNRDKM